MSKAIPIPGKDEISMTRQDLFEIHQSFVLIQTSQNPMWKAVNFLQKKQMKKFYDAKCASDNLTNGVKVDKMVRKLNDIQNSYLEFGADGQPIIDTTKPANASNGQPQYVLKEGLTMADFNKETHEYLSARITIKAI